MLYGAVVTARIRWLRGILSFVLCCLLLASPAFGQSIFAQQSLELVEGLDTQSWQQQVSGIDVDATLKRFASGDFSIDGQLLLAMVKEAVFGEVAYCLPALLRVMVISLLLTVLVAFRGAFGSDDTARLVEMIAYLAAAIPLAVDFMALVAKGEQAIGAMVTVAQNVLPSMIALLASVGAGVTVTAMQPVVLTAGSFIASFLQGVVLQVLRFCAMLVLVNSISPNERFTRLIKLMKTFVSWTLGTCFTAFLGVLAVKGIGGGAFDSVAIRAAKYAVDNLVPVVGGLFKDSLETLAGCSMIVKNAIGLTGMLSLVAALLAPGISILVVIIGYRLCAALMEPLGQTQLLSVLDNLASVLTTLLVTLLTVAAIFFVFVTVLMMIGTGF